MAKEQKPEQTPAPAPDAAPEDIGPPKSYRLQITLGFVCIILFQMIILWLLLPSRQAVATFGGLNTMDEQSRGTRIDGIEPGPPNLGPKETLIEMPIGDKAFKVKNVRNEANETFSMFIRVGIRKADERNFTRRYEQSMYAIQDRVTTILNASTDEERNEAALTTIKNRIQRAINDVLGTPWVQVVYCTEVSLESS